MKEENIKAVEKFLNALRQKDLSLAPIAEDLRFGDPISGDGSGIENFRAFLSGFLPALDDVRIIQHVCENEYVVTHWEADGVFGVISVIEKFKIENGEITEAFGFFDPRPILGD